MKRYILIVDDVEINRAVLAVNFEDGYEILEAENGEQALELIKSDKYDIAVILLDLIMPVMDGITLLKKMNDEGIKKNIPVFIVTGDDSRDRFIEAYSLGADDVIKKPIDSNNAPFIRCRVDNTTELYRHRNDLESMVAEHAEKLNTFYHSMVETLASIVEFRDCESGEHVKRIRFFTEILMKRISQMYPEYRLPKAEIYKIGSASVLHDVGKIAISDTILNKPGRLTPEEFEIMKTHTIRGCEIIKMIPEMLDSEVYNYSYDIARHHHERWDGRGYPDGLKGDEIPIWSQVVAVADVYDALVSPRVYKAPFTHEKAVEMIIGGECGAFNPKVLEAFKLCVDKLKEKYAELTEDSEGKLN